MLGIYAIVDTDIYGWTSAHTVGVGGAALGLFGAFAVLQTRVRNPIMPPRLLRLRALYAPNFVRGLLYLGLTGQFFLGTLYLQRVEGYSALHTGLAYCRRR